MATKTTTLYEADSKALATFGQVSSYAALLYMSRVVGEDLGECELTQRELAEATGIGIRWIERQWDAVTGRDGPLRQVRPGVYRARPAAWPDLGERPWFHKIPDRVVAKLLALGKEGRIGVPTLRLALHLLPTATSPRPTGPAPPPSGRRRSPSGAPSPSWSALAWSGSEPTAGRGPFWRFRRWPPRPGLTIP